MTMQAGNPPTNPFDHAFEMLGRVPQITTEEVNADALEKLTQALTSRARDRGRMVLLRSPRAGFGKTHLLMRLYQRVAHTHEFIPLEPSKGKELDAQSVLNAVLRRFSRILPAGGGLTVLDLLARRILATGLEPLVKSGEVPSQDRESALQALQARPVETFDFHNAEAVTAQWAMANFSLLGPRLTAELAERTHSGFRPVAWWVELLFRYSSTPVDQTTRNSSLFETVFSGANVETDMHEKLVTLLNLTGLVTSPVLILDEVEGFSSNPEAALQVATFLNALHQSCEKLALIISVNGDVWETAFLPRIPCGLKDRLNDIVVDLKPMDKETALSMLRDRAGDNAEAIADELDFDSGVIYARGVIRCAANAWPDVVGDEEPWQGEQASPKTEPISLAEQESAEQQVREEPAMTPHPDLHSAEATAPEDPEPVPVSTEPEPELEASDSTGPSEGYTAEPLASPDDDAQAEASQKKEPSQVSEADVADLASLLQPFLKQEGEAGSEAPIAEASPFVAEQHPVTPAAPVQEPTPEAWEKPVDDRSEMQAVTEPPESLEVPPQNVVNSPFSIDTSAPVESPFRSADAEPGPANGPDSSVSPQDESPEKEAHVVNDDDHEKVEDLLKQFRDRYGRD